MSPGNIEADYSTLPTGRVSIGGLEIRWDFTAILDERRRIEKLERLREHFITTDGRTLMPKYGII